MVLHLLGKKSWNVYNGENVERVRRDEADARAREEAQEQRMQAEDAARRLAILRGERPPELIEQAPTSEHERTSARNGTAQPRKRRRRRGEDDTDAEIRHARQDVEAGEQARRTLARPGKDHGDAPLLDHAGHLQLIPAPDEKDIRKAQKNAEAEAEKARKRKREEDQYTMRFSNAAGFNSSTQQKPWYAAGQDKPSVDEQDSRALVLADAQGKDVWGNEDPRRKEREQSRMSKSDPFAAMQHAQRQLKQSERDREKWQRERAIETDELKRAEKRERREHRRRREDEGSLDGFSLDSPARDEDLIDRERRHHHKRRHRRRSRSVGRSRERRRDRRV